MGYFEPIFIEQGYVEDLLELIIVVVTDVGISSLGSQEIITLFPDTDGMGFDARKVFQVFDSECVHGLITQRQPNCSDPPSGP
jgi:hypothetical protein